jgi:hypothetical protein
MNHHLEIVKLLIDAKADMMSKAMGTLSLSRTSLLIAVYEYTSQTRIDLRKLPEFSNRYGSDQKCLEIVKVLIAANADINAQDDNRYLPCGCHDPCAALFCTMFLCYRATALHYAATNSKCGEAICLNLVTALIDANAKLNIPDNAGYYRRMPEWLRGVRGFGACGMSQGYCATPCRESRALGHRRDPDCRKRDHRKPGRERVLHTVPMGNRCPGVEHLHGVGCCRLCCVDAASPLGTLLMRAAKLLSTPMRSPGRCKRCTPDRPKDHLVSVV